ncbi:MAG TPA: hypothetical protein VI814_05935, partial [Candidatus Limnocylindria bacterium]
GRVSDALVASAMYSQNIASAAADLAPTATSDLARQLESRFDGDRARAQTLATSLGTNELSAPAARVLELIATPTAVSGDTGVVRVASTAAGVAEQLVQAAEESASDPADEAGGQASTAPRGRATTEVTAAPDTTAAQTAHARANATATARPRPDQRKANEALRAVKRAAEETRAAADRAKSQGHDRD